MARVFLWMVGAVALIGSAAYAEHLHYQANVITSIGYVDPLRVEMSPSPINPKWIIEGRPDTRSGEIARTADGSTHVVIWSTTASRFNWYYDFDETVTILDGEAFISDRGKPERRLGPGDSIFFPNGAHAIWRVPDHVRKFATFKTPLPTPVASLLRWIHTAKRWMRGTTAIAAIEPRGL